HESMYPNFPLEETPEDEEDEENEE
ncbi:phage portal protein, SPP1 family, partial [Clostridium botulinum CFSAN001627]